VPITSKIKTLMSLLLEDYFRIFLHFSSVPRYLNAGNKCASRISMSVARRRCSNPDW